MQKKKKIVFLCHGGRWANSAEAEFREFLESKGLARRFDICSVGIVANLAFLKRELEGASLVVSPFFYKKYQSLFTRAELKKLDALRPQSKRQKVLFEKSGSNFDLEKTFVEVLKRALSQ